MNPSGPLGPEPAGATPLDEDDVEGLIPGFVATRGDLNQVEFQNIAAALPWARNRARVGGLPQVLQSSYLFQLHRRMFGDVWTWAGTQRRRMTNIGVDPSRIPDDVQLVLDDARYWHDHGVWSADERAVRLHHRLVSVHPFPNGNGRTTRLLADLSLEATDAPPLTWGSGRLTVASSTRASYLAALRAADAGDYGALIAFSRS